MSVCRGMQGCVGSLDEQEWGQRLWDGQLLSLEAGCEEGDCATRMSPAAFPLGWCLRDFPLVTMPPGLSPCSCPHVIDVPLLFPHGTTPLKLSPRSVPLLLSSWGYTTEAVLMWLVSLCCCLHVAVSMCLCH